MGLLNLIKEDESLKFISLKEAINLLAEKTNSNIYEVATYLLNKNVPAQLDSHARQNNYRIEATSSSMDETHWYGENHCSIWLNYIAENGKNYPSFRVGVGAKYNKGCEENFWNRSDFLNLDCIKDLNVFSAEDTTIDKQQMYIWDTNYLNILKNDVPDLKEIDPDIFVNEAIYFEDSNKATHQEIKKYPLYFKNDVFTVQESACLISNYDPNLVGNKSRKVVWLNENPRYVEAENFIYSAVRGGLFEELDSDFYVVRAEILKSFLSSKEIFIDGFNEKESNASNDENLTENTKLKNTIANLELDVAIEKMNVRELNEEVENLKERIIEKDIKIEKLKEDVQKENGDAFILCMDLDKAKHDMKQLKAKIEQLESEQSANSLKSENLLDLVFDESRTERYAPDLVHSIRLWEALYVDNTASTDKHSNRSNYWIKTNTPYKNETSVEVKRLREITSPFDNWNSDRKKKLKSN